MHLQSEDIQRRFELMDGTDGTDMAAVFKGGGTV